VIENGVLRRIFKPKGEDARGDGEDDIGSSFMRCIPYQVLFKSRRMGWAGHVTLMVDIRDA